MNKSEGETIMKEYREDGMILNVEVLEDNSDDKWIRYKLKVVTIKRESPIYYSPEIGEVFNVEQRIGSGTYAGMWRLS